MVLMMMYGVYGCMGVWVNSGMGVWVIMVWVIMVVYG